jgi:hypothetical protein
MILLGGGLEGLKIYASALDCKRPPMYSDLQAGRRLVAVGAATLQRDSAIDTPGAQLASVTSAL